MKKKKNWKYLFSLIGLLCITGCGKTDSEIPTESDNTITPISITALTLTPTPSPAVTQAVFMPEKQEIVEEKLITGLCEVLEQVDCTEQAKYNSLNRVLVNDIATSQNSLFCVDESTGVVYFVNQGMDNYLYRMRQGEVALAVELPVKEIYTYGGKVYFMIESYDMYELENMSDGDIYCYAPADGTVTLLYPAGKNGEVTDHRLTVNETGIYFQYSTYGEPEIVDGEKVIPYDTYYYKLPFDTLEPEVDNYKTTMAGWKEYYLGNARLEGAEKVTKALLNRITGSEDVIPLSYGVGGSICVVEDTVYCRERTAISSKNLITGEEERFDCWEQIKAGFIGYTPEEIQKIESGEDKRLLLQYFTITDAGKYIWTTDTRYLYRIDVETKEVISFAAPGYSNSFANLYTDGIQLYGCYGSAGKGVARILTDGPEQNDFGQTMVKIEYLVQ